MTDTKSEYAHGVPEPAPSRCPTCGGPAVMKMGTWRRPPTIALVDHPPLDALERRVVEASEKCRTTYLDLTGIAKPTYAVTNAMVDATDDWEIAVDALLAALAARDAATKGER